MSPAFTPAIVDSIDSFYKSVRDAMTALAPSQVFHGIIEAQDWPNIQIDPNGGLYLLVIASNPVPEFSRPYQTYFEHFVQWNWVWMGQDLVAGQVAPNRGDRYRNQMATFELLRQAHFPGFTPKLAITGYDPTTGSGTFTPYSPVEMVKWTAPKLQMREQSQAGIVYGVATLQISAYSTVNPIVNP